MQSDLPVGTGAGWSGERCPEGGIFSGKERSVSAGSGARGDPRGYQAHDGAVLCAVLREDGYHQFLLPVFEAVPADPYERESNLCRFSLWPLSDDRDGRVPERNRGSGAGCDETERGNLCGGNGDASGSQRGRDAGWKPQGKISESFVSVPVGGG